jgi:hypothetical protein
MQQQQQPIPLPPVMQNLVDSFCQCFSGAVPPTAAAAACDSQSLDHDHPNTDSATASTKRLANGKPDLKRRSRSLGAVLNDTNWEALFSTEGACPPRRNRSSTTSNATSKSPQPESSGGLSLEQAQAVAMAKWAALSKPPRKSSLSPSSSNSTKRKRTRSRDDIFRSKREPPPHATNVLSRFLSNHPALMNSLCFATPIRGDSDMGDAASVVSDSNTLNTAEDTITSTLYYETTKLAGLKQKNPPMPLFNSHAVEAKDDIHTIVVTRSHSSFKLLDNTYKHESDGTTLELEEEATPPSSPTATHRASHHRHSHTVVTESRGCEETPPPVTKLSSDSSKS